MAEADGNTKMENDSPLAKRICQVKTPECLRLPNYFYMDRAVKVSNLPRELTFMERSFRRFLESVVRRKLKVEVEVVNTITNLYQYSKEDSSIFVEFCTVQIAEAVVNFKDVKWHKEKLSFQAALYANETMADMSMNLTNLTTIVSPTIASTPNAQAATTPVDTTQVESMIKNLTPFSRDKSKVRRKLVHNQESTIRKKLSIDNTNEETVPYTAVSFENLESPFRKEDFATFLDRHIQKKCVFPNEVDKSFILHDYNEEGKSIIAQFKSPEVALSVCKELQFKEYMGEKMTLSLRSVEYVSPSDINGNDIELPLTCLHIENLEAPFRKEDFATFLDRHIQKKCDFPNEVDKSFILHDYNEEGKSIIAQFKSPEVALAVCNELQFKEYMGENMTLSLRSDEYISPTDVNGNDIELPLTCLRIENLEAPFRKEDFATFLDRHIQEKCDFPNEVDKSFILHDYNEEGKSIVAQFKSPEVALAVCNELQFKEYMGENMTLSLENEKCIMVDTVTTPQRVATSQTQRGTTSQSNYDFTIDDEGYAGPLGATFPLGDDNNAETIILESDEGKAILYQALLKTRNLFCGKNHATGFVQIVAYLKQRNVSATISDVTRMRRNLNNQWNVHKKNNNYIWPQYKMCNIIFGKGAVNDEDKVEFGDALTALDPTEVCKLFTKGAVFTSDSRSFLIKIVTENVERRGEMFFWNSVSDMMDKQGGFYHTAADCQAEFQDLDRRFKDVEVLRKKTGAPHKSYITNWRHYDEMRDLAAADVAHNPEVTISAGSSSVSTEAPQALSRREGINPLKRPKTKTEKKADTLNNFLLELKRGNDLKEKWLAK